jgi:HSP20 family protein
MAKNDKSKEVAVKKGDVAKKELRALSPLASWEREIERLFDEFPRLRRPFFRDWEPFRVARELRIQPPTVDMYEEKGDVVVKAELPGMNKDEVEVTLSDSHLTIKGEKRKEEKVEEKNYYRCEREYGSFLRTIQLPSEVKAEGVKATFKDGVLQVRMPKSEQAKKKQVQVRVQ